MRKKKPEILPNPVEIGGIAVRFRNKKGAYALPSQAAFFELKLPGQRKVSRFPLPKELKKVFEKKAYITAFLQAFFDQHRKKEAKKRKKKVKEKLKKKSSRLSKKEKQKRKKIKKEVIEELLEEPEIPLETKKRKKKLLEKTLPIEKIVAVESREPIRLRTGKPVKAKRPDSRTGTEDFVDQTMDLVKLHVDLKKPIGISTFTAPEQLTGLRKFFESYAERFMLDMYKKKTEEAYILRVKTLNKVVGFPLREQGIGTERWRMKRNFSPDDLKSLKERYPHLKTRDALIRQGKIEILKAQMEDLFNYFMNRYETYLGKQMVEEIKIRGFSMEVVEKITPIGKASS